MMLTPTNNNTAPESEIEELKKRKKRRTHSDPVIFESSV